MSQIGISVSDSGEGTIFTDRPGTVPCQRMLASTINPALTWKCVAFHTAVCTKCKQVYNVETSG